MITRFVQLKIKDCNILDFKKFALAEKKDIIAFKGCHDLEVYHDINTPNIFFTKSIWDSEGALNKYRESDFFKANWKLAKTWFADRANAWSLEKL